MHMDATTISYLMTIAADNYRLLHNYATAPDLFVNRCLEENAGYQRMREHIRVRDPLPLCAEAALRLRDALVAAASERC